MRNINDCFAKHVLEVAGWVRREKNRAGRGVNCHLEKDRLAPTGQGEHRPGKAAQSCATAAKPVQCAAAMRWIFKLRKADNVFAMRSSPAARRCKPPSMA